MNKEDRNIEYKQSWHDEYLKWIFGFANAQGGSLLPLPSKSECAKLDEALELVYAWRSNTARFVK